MELTDGYDIIHFMKALIFHQTPKKTISVKALLSIINYLLLQEAQSQLVHCEGQRDHRNNFEQLRSNAPIECF